MPRRTVTTNTQEQTLTDKTLVEPIITDPTTSGGTMTGGTIIGATINTATINDPTINNLTLDEATLTKPTITGAVIDSVVSVKFHGAVGDGTTDDTVAIQAALDSGALNVFVPPGTYKTTSALVLRENQTLLGANRPNLNDTTRYGSVIEFRPVSSPASCITNVAGVVGQSVRNIEINLASNQDFGIVFVDSYANRLERLGFTGTMDVGIFLDDTYVCDVTDVVFNTASVKRYCVYVGATNTTTIRRVHTSGFPNDSAVVMVGIGLKQGRGSTIEDCVLQGPTIGISLLTPRATVIRNPYFENTICNIRTGDPTQGATAVSTTILGGTLMAAVNTHSQYANRGPLIYTPRSWLTNLIGVDFGTTNATDASTWPLVATTTTRQIRVDSCHFQGSGTARAELFMESASANPSYTITGEVYGSNLGTEIILKKDGAFGGTSYGIRVDSAGTVTTSAWTPPVIGSAVDALLTAAFVQPTPP